MQYNKVSQFCASVGDTQNIITHYLALSFTIKLEKTVLAATEKKF